MRTGAVWVLNCWLGLVLTAAAGGCRGRDTDGDSSARSSGASEGRGAAAAVETMEAEFSKFAAPGESLTVTLPDEAFPSGSTVTLSPAEGCAWRFERTRLAIGPDPARLTVEGPAELRLRGRGLDPPLEVNVEVEAAGKPADRRVVQLTLTAAQVAALTSEPKVAPVPRRDAEIQIDGDLAEWQGIGLLDLPYHGRRSSCARFCWRPDGLYGALDVDDDRIQVPQELSDTFQADGLELWIETDFARSLDTTRNPRASKFAIGPDPGAGPGKARSAVIFGGLKDKPNTIAAAWAPRPGGYTLEFRLPAEMLVPARMEAGATMGFHYVLFNDAGHQEDTVQYIRGFYRKPHLWGAIRLAEHARAAGGAGATGPRAAGQTGAMVFPGRNWQAATPESQGVDRAGLDEAMRVLAEIAEDHGDGTKSAGNTQTAVIRSGYLIWTGADIDNLHTVYSCGKSFMSSVFGLLHDDGKCGPETLAAEILPALKEHYPAATLGQFADLTSGYNVPWRESPFRIRPPLHAPGKAFHYSTSSDQLAHLLTRVAGEPLRDLFKRRIADPIGIPADRWRWEDVAVVDGLAVCGGSGHVSITAREFARFGLLYLAEGRWGDKQVLSRKWVEISTRPHVEPNVPPHDPAGWYVHLPGRYGLNWWTNGVDANGERWWPSAPPRTFAAQGNRNNYCFVIPEWRMVLVRMGNDKAIDSRRYDKVFAAIREALGEAGDRARPGQERPSPR